MKNSCREASSVCDSLVLTSGGVTRSYYRKNNIEDLNKKAKAIASMQAKKALKEATTAQ